MMREQRSPKGLVVVATEPKAEPVKMLREKGGEGSQA